jgi:hypothetical protein
VIQGIVRDSTGGVLPETLITARNIAVGTSRTCITSMEGFFTAIQLPVGMYEITAQRMKFADVMITGITVNVGQTRSIEGAETIIYIELLRSGCPGHQSLTI